MDEAEFGVNDISEEEYKRLKEKKLLVWQNLLMIFLPNSNKESSKDVQNILPKNFYQQKLNPRLT